MRVGVHFYIMMNIVLVITVKKCKEFWSHFNHYQLYFKSKDDCVNKAYLGLFAFTE